MFKYNFLHLQQPHNFVNTPARYNNTMDSTISVQNIRFPLRRFFIADFILFTLGFLSYIVQVVHSRKVLVLPSHEREYGSPTLVKVRNYKYGSSILIFGAAAVLSMIVLSIVSAFFQRTAEILLWLEMGFIVVWAIGSFIRRNHIFDMVFAFICLSLYCAYFGIVFSHTSHTR